MFYIRSKEAQESGHIPPNEPFDPTGLMSVGDQRQYPFWLSAQATRSFHAFFKTLSSREPHGWSSVVGYDDANTGHRLSWLYFKDKVLWAKTSVRRQDLAFPHDDLLDQIDTCELGIRLRKYLDGEIRAITPKEFEVIFDRFCERCDPHPSHSMGASPIARRWDFTGGWQVI